MRVQHLVSVGEGPVHLEGVELEPRVQAWLDQTVVCTSHAPPSRTQWQHLRGAREKIRPPALRGPERRYDHALGALCTQLVEGLRQELPRRVQPDDFVAPFDRKTVASKCPRIRAQAAVPRKLSSGPTGEDVQSEGAVKAVNAIENLRIESPG